MIEATVLHHSFSRRMGQGELSKDILSSLQLYKTSKELLAYLYIGLTLGRSNLSSFKISTKAKKSPTPVKL
jgi:hypothetical protein